MERIVIAILLTVFASCSSLPTEHIVSGQDANYCEFPHMVYISIKLRDGGETFCGATLISKKHILSAAHCVNDGVIGISAHFGTTNKLNSSTVIKVKKWSPHPKYSETHTILNDVAVLELTKEVPLSKCIAPLALPRKGDTYADICTAAGWGQTGTKGIFPNQLQKTKINVIPTSKCQNQAAGVTSDQHICIGDNKNKGKNICGGDSGSGLVCRRKSDNALVVAGIASYVFDCDKGFGVYVNTAYFLDYITRHTG